MPEGIITGRLRRAQANLFETLPLFAIAILIAHAGGKEGELTYYGAWTYLIARLVYVPLYAAGIPYIRSMAWMVSLVGLPWSFMQSSRPTNEPPDRNHGSTHCLPQMLQSASRRCRRMME